MIYDETHQLAAVHRAGKNYMLVDASDINTELLQNYSENEARFQKLWLAFFDQIAIQARINPKLQAQNIPKRFWSDTPELAKNKALFQLNRASLYYLIYIITKLFFFVNNILITKQPFRICPRRLFYFLRRDPS